MYGFWTLSNDRNFESTKVSDTAQARQSILTIPSLQLLSKNIPESGRHVTSPYQGLFSSEYARAEKRAWERGCFLTCHLSKIVLGNGRNSFLTFIMDLASHDYFKNILKHVIIPSMHGPKLDRFQYGFASLTHLILKRAR